MLVQSILHDHDKGDGDGSNARKPDLPTMTDSADKLEPFVILARSHKGAAAAKIAADATSAVSKLNSINFLPSFDDCTVELKKHHRLEYMSLQSS